MRGTITKLHFFLLGLALLNFVLKSTIGTSLNYSLAYMITLLVYITGMVLFAWNVKPFRSIAMYLSIYIITPFLALLLWCFGGIFLAVVASVVLYLVYPYQVETKHQDKVIYSKYHGFMGACCPYEVTERKYWLLEKKIADFDLNSVIDFDQTSIISRTGKLELTTKLDRYDYGTGKAVEMDTIVELQVDQGI